MGKIPEKIMTGNAKGLEYPLESARLKILYTSVRVIHTYPVIFCPIGVLFLMHSSP